MIHIARSIATAIFYFAVACVVEEVANHVLRKVNRKYKPIKE